MVGLAPTCSCRLEHQTTEGNVVVVFVVFVCFVSVFVLFVVLLLCFYSVCLCCCFGVLFVWGFWGLFLLNNVIKNISFTVIQRRTYGKSPLR